MEDEKAKLSKEYQEKIGYCPFEDDPDVTVEEVRRILREHDEEEARSQMEPAHDRDNPRYQVNLTEAELLALTNTLNMLDMLGKVDLLEDFLNGLNEGDVIDLEA